MSEQLEDRSFKRLTDTFPVPMLKYLNIDHDRTRPYKTTLEISDNNKQFLDYVLEISKNKVIDLEFHSTVLTLDHLGRYGTYKIYLRIDSKKLVYQCILCTDNPELSKKQLCINENEEIKFNIIFTQEDDADEKIKILEDIINNNKKLTNTDIEIIYLTVALFMKSKLTKSESLLKIAKLTNQVEGLSNEEIHEIKIFQKAFMKKFISENDKLIKEIEKMISLDDMEAMKEIFPKESQKIKQEGIKIGKEEGIEIGMEKGKEEGIEIGMEKGKEEGIEIGMEKGKEEGIEIGMEKGKEEGIEIGMEKGKEEGIEIGMEKGKEEGIEIGKEEEKIKTAENMKKEQINTSIIVKITGLSPET